jgi:MFS family permease
MLIAGNFQNVACGFLSWSQFALLAAPRHIITTRFKLNTPILAGLFYLSPACGFLLGTILGGRLSDMMVKHWIRKRNGLRLPEDRLRGGVVSFFILMPAGYLAFGWGIECDECSRTRLAVPIITAFVVAAGIFDAMTSLNTYCSEVLPHARRDVIAGKYLVQYTFSSIESAVSVLLIDAIGLGPASTLSNVAMRHHFDRQLMVFRCRIYSYQWYVNRCNG